MTDLTPQTPLTEPGPWWKRKRVLVPVAVVALFGACSGAGDTDTVAPAATETVAAVTETVETVEPAPEPERDPDPTPERTRAPTPDAVPYPEPSWTSMDDVPVDVRLDTAYRVLRNSHPAWETSSDAQILASMEAVCADAAAGGTYPEIVMVVIGALTQSPAFETEPPEVQADAAGRLVGLAYSALCPRHLDSIGAPE